MNNININWKNKTWYDFTSQIGGYIKINLPFCERKNNKKEKARTRIDAVLNGLNNYEKKIMKKDRRKWLKEMFKAFTPHYENDKGEIVLREGLTIYKLEKYDREK